MGYTLFRRSVPTMTMPGYIDEKAAIQKRLRRIEGQVRGLQRMVDEDQYCINILDQVSATTRALQAVALELLDDHLSHCVNAVAVGGQEADDKINEASAAIARMVRS
jgi:DNA-binding FrmR family transcriptional regulator